MRKPFFGSAIEVLIPTARNRYGAVTATRSVSVPAKVQATVMEIVEQGTRAKYDGIIAHVPDGTEVQVGAQVKWNGTTYTVKRAFARTDHRGIVHHWQVEAVVTREG